jgi:ribonuclease HI
MNLRSNRRIAEGDMYDSELERIREYQDGKREREHLLSCGLASPRRPLTLYCAAAYDRREATGAWAAVALGYGKKAFRVGLSQSDSSENFRIHAAIQTLQIFRKAKGIHCISEFDTVARRLAHWKEIQPSGRAAYLWATLRSVCTEVDALWSIPCDWTHQALSGLQSIAEDELRRMNRLSICDSLKNLEKQLYIP